MKLFKAIVVLFFIVLTFNISATCAKPVGNIEKEMVKVLRTEVLSRAKLALKQEPQTVTKSICSRSAGGKHDFYSEGDYWWPDPKNPDGPFI